MASADEVERLSRKVREKESELSEAKGRLEATQKEAEEKYGTSDIEEIKKKKEKIQRKKEKLEEKKEKLEGEIESELEKIENEESNE